MLSFNYRDEANYNVEQKLQSYLRDKFDRDSLAVTDRQTVIRLLKQIARDYDLKRKQNRSEEEYTRLADSAIDTFIGNHA